MAILLIALALFSLSKQKNFMQDCSQELNDTVNEAMNVRIELENIMQEALGISQTIVHDFEDKLSPVRKYDLHTENHVLPVVQEPEEDIRSISEEILNLSATDEPVLEQLNKAEKIRIYELARELEMPSKELINLIKSLGIHVNNHMNMLDKEQVLLIRHVITDDNPIKQPQTDTPISILASEPITPPIPTQGGFLDLIIGNKTSQDEEYLAIADSEPGNSADDLAELIQMSGLDFSIEELKTAHPYLAVRTLHEKGYPVREIAKILDRGQGEVSLILNIAKKKSAVI